MTTKVQAWPQVHSDHVYIPDVLSHPLLAIKFQSPLSKMWQPSLVSLRSITHCFK